MASIDEVELKKMSQEERAKALGMTTEQLTGRSLFIEFNINKSNFFKEIRFVCRFLSYIEDNFSGLAPQY